MVFITELIFYCLTFILFTFATICFIYIFTILHEVLHGFACSVVDIPFKILFNFRRGITRIDDELLTDKKFTFIALTPYFILLPFFHYMFINNNVFISLFGVVGFVWHGLNLPMEFINYVKHKKKNVKSSTP